MVCESEFSATHSEDDGHEPTTCVNLNITSQNCSPSRRGATQVKKTAYSAGGKSYTAAMRPRAGSLGIPQNCLAGTEEETTIRASIMDNLKYIATENEVDCLVKLSICLNEKNMNLLERVVLRVGVAVCQEVLEETLVSLGRPSASIPEWACPHT